MEAATPHPEPRKNYIFVDYENVQDLDLNLLDGKPVEVFLVIGPTRKTLPVDLTKQIKKFHDRVHLVDCEKAGRNALDMVLGYELGRQAATNSHGYFHILSKDKDFDPLVEHLREAGILASRDEVFSKIPVLMAAAKLGPKQRAEAALDWLRKH